MEKKSMSSFTARPRRLPSKASFAFAFRKNRRGWILGILNATPDSFYGPSRGLGRAWVLAQAERLMQEGVDAVDIGAESTRPGAADVPAAEEKSRILPLIQALRHRFPRLPISVDTRKASVAAAALAAGANLVNDISALQHDPAMAETLAQTNSPVILMHMQGTPQTMQRRPRYRDVVSDVKAFFEERLRFSVRAGIAESRILLDPGIGFGKTVAHNITLLARLRELLALGRPLVIGVSRKSFIGKILGSEAAPVPVEHRLEGSLSVALWSLQQGAAGLRVHDVAATQRAVRLWTALQKAQTA